MKFLVGKDVNSVMSKRTYNIKVCRNHFDALVFEDASFIVVDEKDIQYQKGDKLRIYKIFAEDNNNVIFSMFSDNGEDEKTYNILDADKIISTISYVYNIKGTDYTVLGLDIDWNDEMNGDIKNLYEMGGI